MLKTTQLGRNSGLRVSQLCLGTMNFGTPGRGHQGDWTLDLDQARPIFKAAIDNGLFYFDCADVYGVGACETVVGKLLRELLQRDEYVLGTKVAIPMGNNMPEVDLLLRTAAPISIGNINTTIGVLFMNALSTAPTIRVNNSASFGLHFQSLARRLATGASAPVRTSASPAIIRAQTATSASFPKP